MTISELEALVRRGESDSVEFKKSTGQLTRAAEALCAFLNRHGGLVVVGVSPDREGLVWMVWKAWLPHTIRSGTISIEAVEDAVGMPATQANQWIGG